MNYELLVIVVVCLNILATFSLWWYVAAKPPRPKKRDAKLLWDSDPITPKHAPPKVSFASLPHDGNRHFFSDFAEFADVLNWWLEDKHVQSRWRLQDLPDDDSNTGAGLDYGPLLGLRFAVFYNRARLGELEVSPGDNFTSESPEVSARLEIRWVRLLNVSTITDFLCGIASHVTDPMPNSVGYIAARQAINLALTESLWDTYQISKFEELDNQDWGEVSVSFQGSAEGYITRRDIWRNMNARKVAQTAADTIAKTRTAEGDSDLDDEPRKSKAAHAFSIVNNNIMLAVIIGLGLIYVAFAYLAQ